METCEAASHEWEVSKENVKPIKAGRKLKGLQLRMLPETPESTQEQELRFEEQLKNNTDTEDPLDVWIKYLAWIRQTFPSDTSKSMVLLERCTDAFKTSEKYKNDTRYIKLWIEYADLVPTPGEIFAFLQSNKIGEKIALFWIAWAFVAEKHENFTLTDKIFQKGIQKRAEPRDTLQQRYKQFQRRMARHYLNQTAEGAQASSSDEASRKALSKISSAQAGAATGTRLPASESARQRPHGNGLGLPQSAASSSGRTNSTGFEIFTDKPSVTTSEPSLAENKHWTQLSTQEMTKKENSAPPAKWSESAPIGSSMASLTTRPVPSAAQALKVDEIFVDEEFAIDAEEESGDIDIPGPNIRKQLDGVGLTAHKVLSEHEKILKDPLARHKMGDVVVPVAPTTSQADKASSKPKAGTRELDHSENTALVSANQSFAIFSENPQPSGGVKKATSSAASAEALKGPVPAMKPSASGKEQHQFTIFNEDAVKKAPSSGAFVAKPTEKNTFTIFSDADTGPSGPSLSSKKASSSYKSPSSKRITSSAAATFTIFNDDSKGKTAGESKASEGAAKSVSTRHSSRTIDQIGTKVQVTDSRVDTRSAEGTKQSVANPSSKISSKLFDDNEELLEEVAYDDTTINTKLARIDIDAMFFDLDDNAAPSNSVVFPSTGTIGNKNKSNADMMSDIKEPNGNKHILGTSPDIVIFDDFSAIKSDSVHRSHEVSGEVVYSPYSQLQLSVHQSPAVGTESNVRQLSSLHLTNRKRSCESKASILEEQRKSRRLDVGKQVNSMYLSGSDESSGDIKGSFPAADDNSMDSMQYSYQPMNPIASARTSQKGRDQPAFQLGDHPQSHAPNPIPIESLQTRFMGPAIAAGRSSNNEEGRPSSSATERQIPRIGLISSNMARKRKFTSPTRPPQLRDNDDIGAHTPLRKQEAFEFSRSLTHQQDSLHSFGKRGGATSSVDTNKATKQRLVEHDQSETMLDSTGRPELPPVTILPNLNTAPPLIAATTTHSNTGNHNNQREGLERRPVSIFDLLNRIQTDKSMAATNKKSDNDGLLVTKQKLKQPEEDEERENADTKDQYEFKSSPPRHPALRDVTERTIRADVRRLNVPKMAIPPKTTELKTYSLRRSKKAVEADPLSITTDKSAIKVTKGATSADYTANKTWENYKHENITSDYNKNIADIAYVYKNIVNDFNITTPVVVVLEARPLPKQLGGTDGFPYEQRHTFKVQKKASLGDNWVSVNRFIGRGTFGYVLQCNSTDLSKEKVVAKVDHKKQFCIWEASIHARMVSRIRQPKEASAYTTCTLPPIALYLLQDASVLVMSCCDMGDLVYCANYLNAVHEGYTHEQINVLIGMQMIEAIRFVHSKHVLHGDIKLNNWVIRTSNASPFGMNIALIDFGKAIDIDIYLRSSEPPASGPHCYSRDLIGVAKTQFNLLFGKEAKFTGRSLGGFNPSNNTYDVHHAIRVIDEIQGTNHSEKDQQDLHIILPSKPPKRFWDVQMWTLLFVSLLSQHTLQNQVSRVLSRIQEDMQRYIAGVDAPVMQVNLAW